MKVLDIIKARHHDRLQQAMFLYRGAKLKQLGIIFTKRSTRLTWIGNDTLYRYLWHRIGGRQLLRLLLVLCGHHVRGAGDESVESSPQTKFLLSHGPSPPPQARDTPGHRAKWDHR